MNSPTADLNNRTCPLCVESVLMEKLKLSGIMVDICPQCRGIYYDEGELKRVLGHIFSSEQFLRQSDGERSGISCPDCQVFFKRLVVNRFEAEIELFFCEDCHSTFIKQSQLILIKRSFDNYRLQLSNSPAPSLRPRMLMPYQCLDKGNSTDFADSAEIPPPLPSASAPPPLPPPPLPSPVSPPPPTPPPLPSVPRMIPRRTIIQVPAEMSALDSEEHPALRHYQELDYEANQEKSIKTMTYIFCLLSQMPVEVYNPRLKYPLMLSLLIGLNVLIFFYLSFIFSGDFPVSRVFGLIPVELFSLTGLFSLISYQFLHAGWMHIIGNMYMLWIFGDNVLDIFYDYGGRNWKFKGELLFIVFYLYTGIVGGLAHTIFYNSQAIPLVGASGAVFGIMGAYLRLFPTAKLYQNIFFFYPVKISVFWYMLLFMVVYQLILATTQGAASQVSWAAHLGGFFAGWYFIPAFMPYSIEHLRYSRGYYH